MKAKAEVNTQKLDSKSSKSMSRNGKETPFQTTFDTPYDRIMYLQRTIGNRAVGEMLNSGILQTRLRISSSNDKYEHKENRIAAQIINMSDPQVQKQAVPEEDQELLETRPLVDRIASLVQCQIRKDKPIRATVHRNEISDEEEKNQTKKDDNETIPPINRLTSTIHILRKAQKAVTYTEDDLFKMSVFPGDALLNWDKLSRSERETILHLITENYDEPFRKEFEKYAKGKLTPFIGIEGRITRTTRHRLKLEKEYRRKGYKKAAIQEISGWRTWVSPSGFKVQILLDPKKRTTRSPLERDHGPVIYFSENPECFRILFARGIRKLEVHADGTIAIYPSTITEMPYTLMLSQTGKSYVFHNPEGGTNYRDEYGAEVDRLELDIDEVFKQCDIPHEIKDEIFVED